MSHIRPEMNPSKHKIADCRRGSHDYGEGQHIGAGIMRRVCEICADVTIDLTGSKLTSDGMTESQVAARLTSARR